MLVTDSRGLQNYSFDEAKVANKVHLHNSMVYLNENKIFINYYFCMKKWT